MKDQQNDKKVAHQTLSEDHDIFVQKHISVKKDNSFSTSNSDSNDDLTIFPHVFKHTKKNAPSTTTKEKSKILPHNSKYFQSIPSTSLARLAENSLTFSTMKYSERGNISKTSPKFEKKKSPSKQKDHLTTKESLSFSKPLSWLFSDSEVSDEECETVTRTEKGELPIVKKITGKISLHA